MCWSVDWKPLQPDDEERLTELLERPQIPQQQMSAQDQTDRRDLLRRASYVDNLAASTENLRVRLLLHLHPPSQPVH